MKKNLIKLLLLAIIAIPACYAQNSNGNISSVNQDKILTTRTAFKRPTKREINKLDKIMESRLNLDSSQIKYLKSNKQKNMKELEKIVNKMEQNRIKIRNIYMLGLPKYQADIKSAPYKMELVILKQNADNIRRKNRKNFEAILTPEQKAEFEIIKSELLRK